MHRTVEMGSEGWQGKMWVSLWESFFRVTQGPHHGLRCLMTRWWWCSNYCLNLCCCFYLCYCLSESKGNASIQLITKEWRASVHSHRWSKGANEYTNLMDGFPCSTSFWYDFYWQPCHCSTSDHFSSPYYTNLTDHSPILIKWKSAVKQGWFWSWFPDLVQYIKVSNKQMQWGQKQGQCRYTMGHQRTKRQCVQ